jgi:hypothetical protein
MSETPMIPLDIVWDQQASREIKNSNVHDVAVERILEYFRSHPGESQAKALNKVIWCTNLAFVKRLLNSLVQEGVLRRTWHDNAFWYCLPVTRQDCRRVHDE